MLLSVGRYLDRGTGTNLLESLGRALPPTRLLITDYYDPRVTSDPSGHAMMTYTK